MQGYHLPIIPRVRDSDESIAKELGIEDLLKYYKHGPEFMKRLLSTLKESGRKQPEIWQLVTLLSHYARGVREYTMLSGDPLSGRMYPVSMVIVPSDLIDILSAIIESSLAGFEEIYEEALSQGDQKLIDWLNRLIESQI